MNLAEIKRFVTKVARARASLLAVVALSVLNIVLLLLNTGRYFVFSGTIPFYLTVFGREFGGVGNIVCMVLAFASIALYFFAWLGSRKKRGWFTAALIFFIIDTIALVGIALLGGAFSFIIDFVAHIIVLVSLISGIKNSGKLAKLGIVFGNAEQMLSNEAAPADADADAAAVAAAMAPAAVVAPAAAAAVAAAPEAEKEAAAEETAEVAEAAEEAVAEETAEVVEAAEEAAAEETAEVAEAAEEAVAEETAEVAEAAEEAATEETAEVAEAAEEAATEEIAEVAEAAEEAVTEETAEVAEVAEEAVAEETAEVVEAVEEVTVEADNAE